MMRKQRLLKKLAYLEFVNDQMQAELCHIDHLLKLVGFEEGLKSIKQASQEILSEQESEQSK